MKNRALNLNYFRVRGCIDHVIDSSQKRKEREDKKRIKSFFIGYAKHGKAYRFLNLKINSVSEQVFCRILEQLTIKDADLIDIENGLYSSIQDNSNCIFSRWFTNKIYKPNLDPDITKSPELRRRKKRRIQRAKRIWVSI